jgi:23S rRNA pseudouridine1911/1915/1917 synthase
MLSIISSPEVKKKGVYRILTKVDNKLLPLNTGPLMKMKITSEIPLLEALAQIDPLCSRNTLRSWLEKGRVVVSGQIKRKGNLMLKVGDEIEVVSRSTFIEADTQIVFEDKHCVVVNKPEGLLSVATDFDASNTVHTFLKKRRQRVFPVHRLDRETSGLMVFAYTEEARDHFKQLFFDHNIEREYQAVVEGVVEETSGTWESYLKEDPDYVVRISDEEKGRRSVTHYAVMKKKRQFTQLRLTLETGRKNQIRVHCSAAGHPIAGDKKYGAKTNLSKRLCLHAARLGFLHPETKKMVRFEAPLPETISKIVS